MIVVSDTSPIRALAFLEQLGVLNKLFGTVVVPPAVADELCNPARLAPGESPPDLSRFLLRTAGVLLRAKRAGFLVEIHPLLDRLIGELGFFIAEPLRRQILEQAGE